MHRNRHRSRAIREAETHDGCPQTLPNCGTPGCYPLGNGWALDTITYIAREDSHAAAPMPEIYYNGRSLCPPPGGPGADNAQEWQTANLWEQTYRSGYGSIIFSGPLTQAGAAIPKGLGNTTFAPDAGWMHFSNRLSPPQSLAFSTAITFAK
ncbi:MAG: hypothetical protein ACR2PL_10845 [Dehalococcoidia bacterium]